MDIKDIENANLISISEFARLENVARSTVYAWIKKGELEVVQVLDKRYIVLSSHNIDDKINPA